MGSIEQVESVEKAIYTETAPGKPRLIGIQKELNMQIGLDCFSCFLRQALQASRFAGLDVGKQRQLQKMTLKLLLDKETTQLTPPELARMINQEVSRISGIDDPYGEQKVMWTERALELLPQLKARISQADDKFDMALRIAVAGNIIDLGPGQEIDLEATLQRVSSQPFTINRRAELEAQLKRAEWILFLADNAGETVFDRAFIPWLGKPIKYAVKGGPIINDAVEADARQAGIHELEGVELVSTGNNIPGTVTAESSPEFQRLMTTAPLIIAKGQAHFETLSDHAGPNVFFIFQVKCPGIANHLEGAELGAMVLAQGGQH